MEEFDQMVENIALNVRTLRKQRRLTQKEVSKRMGVHMSLYSRLEQGSTRISIETLIKVSRLFGVSINKLIYNKEIHIENMIIRRKRGKTFQEKLVELENLTEGEKRIICNLLDLALANKKVQEIQRKIDYLRS
jgi:transcriptional regulator with XRE-family HTH domain